MVLPCTAQDVNLDPLARVGLPRFSTDILNFKFISAGSEKYSFTVCMCQGERGAPEHSCLQSKMACEAFNTHTFLGSASRDSEPMSLREETMAMAWMERQRENRTVGLP